ncbi:MAG: argininosuccinate lyase [archaeon]
MVKVWDKGYEINKAVEKFTVGNDYLLDQKLVKYDCLASIAHAKMLKKIGVLKKEELDELIKGLKEIMVLSEKGKFEIKPEDEDCHTAIENYLGKIGKKIHTARSRNDQVMTAIRLYEKAELKEIKKLVQKLAKSLEKNIDAKMPGYTHTQKAMPTAVKTWLGCYINSSKDNIHILESVIKLIDGSPLGSAAGFGVPVFKIDKKMTAKEMGFARVINNPIHAQMTRGKYESNVLNTLSQIMFDLNKLSSDLIMFNMPEFGFVSLPKELCTGSSIMPQKKNPDVLELIRAKYYVVLGEEFKVKSIIGNLISGYNRDFQETKEPIIKSLEITKSSLELMILMIKGLKINKKNCEEGVTKDLYATEEAYKLVKKGMPFREAYKQIGKKF